MMHIAHKLRSAALTLSILSALAEVSLAQERFEFDSVFRPVDGLQGNAQYEYYLDGSEMPIKDGPFRFSATERDSISTMSLKKVKWEGGYSEDQRVGAWMFRSTDHRITVSDVDEEFRPEVNTVSEQTLIEGTYAAGLPHGKWDLKRVSFLNGKETFVPLTARMEHLQEGKADSLIFWQQINDSGDTAEVRGSTTNGLMDGQWSFHYVKDGRHIIETRTYDTGILLHLTKADRAASDTIADLTFPLSSELQEHVETRSSENESAGVPLSIHFSDGYPRNSVLITEQEDATELLAHLMKELFQFDPDLFERNGLVFGTDRMIYPLSVEEKKVVRSWNETVSALKERTETLRAAINDTPPDGVRELESASAWLDAQERILEHIAPWKSIIGNDEVRFYNRNGLLSRHVVNMLRNDTLILTSNDTLIVNHHTTEELNDNFLLYSHDNLRKRTEVADSVIQAYEQTLVRIALQEKVSTGKMMIRERMAELRELYDNAPEGGQQLQDLHGSVRSKVVRNEMPDRYRTLKGLDADPERKKAAVDSMLSFLNDAKELRGLLIKVFENRPDLDSLYTEYVFDPYTYNDRFPKRLKRRLYESVAERLFDDLMKEAQQQQRLAGFMDIIGLLHRSQKKLVSLIDDDTRRLERKLNKNLSKGEILDLLDLK